MSGYLFGIKYAGPAYTLAISATYPAVGAVLSHIFLGESVTRRGWAGVGVTVLGAIVVTYTPPAGDAPYFYLGIGLATIATLGWGIEGVLAIHAMKTIEPVVAGTLRMATSFVVYAVVVLPLVGGLRVLGGALSHPSFWLVLGASAAGAASYLTYYAANHLVGASRAMPLNSLYAVWAIVFSVALLGLHPTPQLVVGVLVTFAGAVIVVCERATGRPCAGRTAEAAPAAVLTCQRGRARADVTACPGRAVRRRRTPARRATGGRPRRRPRTTSRSR